MRNVSLFLLSKGTNVVNGRLMAKDSVSSRKQSFGFSPSLSSMLSKLLISVAINLYELTICFLRTWQPIQQLKIK